MWQLPIGRGHAIGGDMPAALDAIVGGWQVSSITSIRTGLPVNVSLAASGINPATGTNYSFLNRNGGSLRPNIVGDPNAHSNASANRLQFLDPAAYALQPLFNRTNFQDPSATWGTTSFGVISDAYDPRVMQLAVRFAF